MWPAKAPVVVLMVVVVVGVEGSEVLDDVVSVVVMQVFSTVFPRVRLSQTVVGLREAGPYLAVGASVRSAQYRSPYDQCHHSVG
jgi:hypothetical protein